MDRYNVSVKMTGLLDREGDTLAGTPRQSTFSITDKAEAEAAYFRGIAGIQNDVAPRQDNSFAARFKELEELLGQLQGKVVESIRVTERVLSNRCHDQAATDAMCDLKFLVAANTRILTARTRLQTACDDVRRIKDD